MRKRSLFFGIVAIFCAALFLSGCEQPGSGGSTPPPTLSAPTVDVGTLDSETGKLAATVPSSTTVELSTPTDGAVIFYKFSSTGDNPNPDTDGYTDGLPIEIPGDLGNTVILKAFARKAGWSDSGTLEVVYTVDADAVPVPTAAFSEGVPATGGAVSGDTTLTVDEPEDTTVYYTTDESDPADAANTERGEYTGPAPISQLVKSGETSVTLKVAAVKGSGDDAKASAVRTAVYRIADVIWSAEVDGGVGSTSTGITFTFDPAVSDLAEENITIIPADSVTKGGLTHSETTWTLALADVKETATVSVKIRKDDIDSVPQSYTVYKTAKYAIAIGELTGANGSTITANPSSAAKDEQVTLTVSLAGGYKLKDGSLKVKKADGEEVDTTASGTAYTFTMPDEAVTVTAEFEAVPEGTYTISIDPAITNGTVNADKATAQQNDKVTLTVTAATGYELEADSLKANDTLVELTDGKYTFSMPAANVTVTAVFEAIQYTITTSGIENGTVTADPTSATIGQRVTLTVTPADGYKFTAGSLKVNDGAVTVNGLGPYHFNMPPEDVTVTADFERLPPEVTELSVIPGDGKVTLSWTEPVTTGTNFVFNGVDITYTGGSVPTVPQGTTEKEITGLTNGTTYTFTVKAKYAGGISSNGATIDGTPTSTPLTTLTNVTQTGGAANTATTTGITLTFSAEVTGLVKADIVLTPSDRVTIGDPTGGGTTWTLPVTAVNTAGEVSVSISRTGFGGSRSVTVYKDTTPPAPVTSLTAIPGNGQIALSWTNPTDTDFDHVEITWTGGSVNETGTSKTITGLTNGTAYTFTVTAVDKEGNKGEGVEKEIPVVTWGAEQIGGATDSTGTSTGIKFTFQSDVVLTEDQITVKNGTGSVVIPATNALTGEGTTWTLTLSEVTSGGTVSVSIARTDIAATPYNVTVYKATKGKAPITVTFSGLPKDETIDLTGVQDVPWGTDLTVTVPDSFTVTKWVLGTEVLEETGNSLTISGDDLTVKTYYLTVSVETEDGVPYTNRVTFTVTPEIEEEAQGGTN